MNIAQYIDHTYLKADATHDKIVKLCQEAKTYGFAAVCINPYWVPLAIKELSDTAVKVATVVGFPLGATSTEAKVAETKQAVRDGANEIDMVIAIGALLSGNDVIVKQDIAEVVKAATDAEVKVIIEAALLTEAQKRQACLLACEAGAHFVKTSTGFGPGGATEADVRLMREVVGKEMGVKAAGGIRTRAKAEQMIHAGATRIGASAGVSIVLEAQNV